MGKLVKVRKTFKEIIGDIKDLSLSEKFESIGLVSISLGLFMLVMSAIISAFSKYGVVVGIFAILLLGGIYVAGVGLLIDLLEDIILFYKVEWVEDD